MSIKTRLAARLAVAVVLSIAFALVAKTAYVWASNQSDSLYVAAENIQLASLSPVFAPPLLKAPLPGLPQAAGASVGEHVLTSLFLIFGGFLITYMVRPDNRQPGGSGRT